MHDPRSVGEAEDVGRRPENRLEKPVTDIGEEHGQQTRAQVNERIGHKPLVRNGPPAGKQRQRREDQHRDESLLRIDPVGEPRPEEERHKRGPRHPVDTAPESLPGQSIDDQEQHRPPAEHHKPGNVRVLIDLIADDQDYGQCQQQQQFERMAPPHGDEPLPESGHPLSEIPPHGSCSWIQKSGEDRITRRCAGARPRRASPRRRPRRSATRCGRSSGWPAVRRRV